ncbi:hypothetical protein, partial [uncultured Faecalibaculum sp.]|uniref:hypothetical protein n=1 Tax=uncultured Faecalibaculum sp. TaxID=1729681 RepID=UPI0026379065
MGIWLNALSYEQIGGKAAFFHIAGGFSFCFVQSSGWYSQGTDWIPKGESYVRSNIEEHQKSLS